MANEWSGYPDPTNPDNFWIDDETGERVNATTGERSSALEMILILVDRVNHLTNINDGLRETLDEQRKGLAELRAMLATEPTA